MKIIWNKIKTPEMQAKVRYLSGEFMVRRELHNLYGDQGSEIDVYLHAFSHAYSELRKCIDENELVEYVEGIDDVAEMLTEFAVENFKNPVETKGETVDEYQEKIWLNTAKVFERFVALIATFAYHKYRYMLSPDDRKVEDRNCYYTWLEIKKYNRDNGILFNFTDEELQGTILTWYEQSILPKHPGLFEKVDAKNGHNCSDILMKYAGPKPKIPASEMADGYEFDLGI